MKKERKELIGNLELILTRLQDKGLETKSFKERDLISLEIDILEQQLKKEKIKLLSRRN